jgi:Uma2 family endonuclease
MAETEVHRDLMLDTIHTLIPWFEPDPLVCVSGNLLLYYVQGDKRKHVSPDVFVVRGIPKRIRRYYLLWEEGKGPDAIIEFTSKSTRKEDTTKKFELYRDVLKVQEYFLFDPFEEYLRPSHQGFSLRDGQYMRIDPVAGRLPSEVLGLHLERNGSQLRLFDPAAGQWLPTPQERLIQTENSCRQAENSRTKAELARQAAELARQQAELAKQQAELARQQAELAKQRVEGENELLRRELEALRRRPPDGS